MTGKIKAEDQTSSKTWDEDSVWTWINMTEHNMIVTACVTAQGYKTIIY